jgi:pyridoxine 5'-phosphate synthase PdxJ
MNIQERLLRSIKQRTGNVILRAELAGRGSSSQITAALKALQDQGVIVRIGTGVYAKTRISSVTGALVPAGSLESLVSETLKRLGVSVSAGSAATAYNTGKTTQLPGAFVANTGRRRISRKIAVGGRQVVYENDFGRAEASA